MGFGIVAPSQAWAILVRHANNDIGPLRLESLCRDDDRVKNLVAVHNSHTEHAADTDTGRPCVVVDRTLIVDLSRQRMTDTTLNHLLSLASSLQLKQFIRQVAWGQNHPDQPVQAAPVQHLHSASSSSMPFHPSKLTRFQEMADANYGATELHHAKQQRQPQPMVQSMHLALRVPEHRGHVMRNVAGENVLDTVHKEWRRIQRTAASIRSGKVRGATGQIFRDIVVVGRGVCVSALQFLYTALLLDEAAAVATRSGLPDPPVTMQGVVGRFNFVTANSSSNSHQAMSKGRRLRFITTIDPVASTKMLSQLDPASTLVISIALCGNEETGLTTKTFKTWLLQNLTPPRSVDSTAVLAKHMILVTSNERIASVIHRPESVHVLPSHTRNQAFLNCSSATILPLAIVFGWPVVQDILAGAHDMDAHFVDTNPRHNLPVLLALTDVWNTTCCRGVPSHGDDDAGVTASGRAVTPVSAAFEKFPAFVASLEAQTCSGGVPSSTTNTPPVHPNNIVLDAGLDGALDKILYQSETRIDTELCACMDSQVSFNRSRVAAPGNDEDHAHDEAQDALICSLLAHADELAFGSGGLNQHQQQVVDGLTLPSSNSWPLTNDGMLSPSSARAMSRGNRTSTLILCGGKLDAFVCGQLVALAEHRAVTKAHLWGFNPFSENAGSSIRADRSDELKADLEKMFSSTPPAETDVEDEEQSHLTLSTKTLLGHYATLFKGQRDQKSKNAKLPKR